MPAADEKGKKMDELEDILLAQCSPDIIKDAWNWHNQQQSDLLDRVGKFITDNEYETSQLVICLDSEDLKGFIQQLRKGMGGER